MEHTAEVAGIGVGMNETGSNVPAVVLSAREEYLPIVMTEFGGAVDGIRIDDLADGTFYAKIDAERYEDGQPHKHVFDARPSDAVALAVRVDCPIVVSDEVLDVAGQSESSIELEDLDDGR